MTGAELLADLRARGVRLWSRDDALYVAPRALLVEADRADITAHQPALLSLLADREQLERAGTAGRLRSIAATQTQARDEASRTEPGTSHRLAEVEVRQATTAVKGAR